MNAFSPAITRMSRTFAGLLALLFLATSPRPCFAVEPGAVPVAGKTVRLLTIGNSFSANATHYLADLATAGGHKLIHRPIVVGGASLQLHAEKAQQFEADSTGKSGLYKNERSLKQEVRLELWDFVTIQQASIKSHDLKTYQPYAGWLRDYVKKYAPQATLLVHETWAYRRDDPRFTKPSGKPGEPVTQEAMYRALNSAYTTVATDLGARRIPVGTAFFLADTDPKWGFQPDTKFDVKSAVAPALPDQTHSLHVGWKWMTPKNGPPKLAMDGHHASLAGEYLGACVFYEVVFGQSTVGNTFIPSGLDREYAQFLQQTAHTAVETSKPAVARENLR